MNPLCVRAQYLYLLVKAFPVHLPVFRKFVAEQPRVRGNFAPGWTHIPDHLSEQDSYYGSIVRHHPREGFVQEAMGVSGSSHVWSGFGAAFWV